LEEATIPFSEGLNVIYGPSDTGKTFIVQCIDFIFGGKAVPKAIPEAKGYDKISLVISPWDSPVELKLTRSLKGGELMLFAEGQPSRKLSEKHKANSVDCVSRFLLGLTSLDGKQVRINKNGKTDPFSFRDLARLVIVDEEEVIGERSPYLSGQFILKTKERSVFRLLLTGVDDSSIIASEDSKISEARNEAKVEVIKKLLYESIKELDEMGLQLDESAVKQANEDVLRKLEGVKAEISAEQDAISALERKRRSLWEDYKRSQSQLAVLSELCTRFDLLSDQYRSDLKRLEAISEAGGRLAQMPEERCPVCGALPEFHREDHVLDPPLEELARSCTTEALKIQALIEDLSETNRSNDFKIKAKTEYAQRIHTELIEANNTIKDELQPRFQTVATKIRELTDKQLVFLRALYLYESVGGFRTLLRVLAEEKHQKSDKDAFTNLSVSAAEEFSKEIEAVLREWKFPDLNRVTFSESDDDVIISGRKRASHGKGVRAITHTAFNLGLLRFCRNQSMPHPGLLVVDSPLVMYRQADDQNSDPGDESFSTDVKEAFYRSLSAAVGIQVIICENDDPPADLSANIIHFTGTNEGRYGFIPKVKEDSQ
jgi:rubrerythrin